MKNLRVLFLLLLWGGVAAPRWVSAATWPDLNMAITSARDIHRRLIEHSDVAYCAPMQLSCFRNDRESLRRIVSDYTLSELNASGGNLKSLISGLRQIDDAEFAAQVRQLHPTSSLIRDWDRDPPFAFREQM
jgi:hypothetical protein